MEVNSNFNNGKDSRYDLLCHDLAGQIDGIYSTGYKLLKTADGMSVKEVIASLNENLDSIGEIYNDLLKIDGVFLSTSRNTFRPLFDHPVPEKGEDESEAHFEDRLRCLITVDHIMAVRKMCLEIKKIDIHLANIAMLIDQVHALAEARDIDFGLGPLGNNLLAIITKNISLLDTMYLGRVSLISKTHKHNQSPRIEELKKLYSKSIIYLSNFYSEESLVRDVRLAKSDLIPVRHKFKLSLESLFANELGNLSMIA